MSRLVKRFETIRGPAMLDGEMVALRNDGTSSFHDLQVALSAERDDKLYFYAFDFLHLDGRDLRPCALPTANDCWKACTIGATFSATPSTLPGLQVMAICCIADTDGDVGKWNALIRPYMQGSE